MNVVALQLTLVEVNDVLSCELTMVHAVHGQYYETVQDDSSMMFVYLM